MPPGMRADARRNVARIVAAAAEAFARHGAEASLEEIARSAGVGSATLHRHFPGRQALLEAVFRERVEELCERARELAGTWEPGPALVGWLRAVSAHAASNRGLAAALACGAADGDPEFGRGCHALITAAGMELLDRAQAAGAARTDVAITELLTLVSAVALATETGSAPAADADRLVRLALEGLAPGR
jgi:AcrR family transcriptional regulator